MPKKTKVHVEVQEDILDRLLDLHKQATTENSHYYVASCCRDAIEEIEILRKALKPFADYASPLMEKLPNNEPVTAGSPMARRQITVGDIKGACAALLGL